MPNIRTANKNHKRTLAAQVARDKALRDALIVAAPAPALAKTPA